MNATSIEFHLSQGLQPDEIPEQFACDPYMPDEVVLIRKWVLAATALMKQRLMISAKAHINSHDRKALRRDGVAVDDINVVQLRQVDYARHGQTSVVDWSHRWIVNGHWRQQWYPTQQEHRVIWIPPHIKGPADKPLVVNDRVFSVSR